MLLCYSTVIIVIIIIVKNGRNIRRDVLLMKQIKL